MTPSLALALALTSLAPFAGASAVRTERAQPSPRTRTYADVKGFILGLAAHHPLTTRAIVVGESDSGEKVMGLAIGSGEVHDLVVGTHHGNEYGATEVALAFAESIAQAPIEGRLIYVIPVLNVNGYDGRDRSEFGLDQRSHDPNRDYPGPCGTEGPFALKSTKTLADFIDRENIVASATLHTYYPAVVYPWGIPAGDLSTPYDAPFRALAEAATVESGYAVGNSTEVIYSAVGTFEDYAFWKHGVWSLLFELGFSHSPSDHDVQRMIQVNVPGLRRMMTLAPGARAPEHAFAGRCEPGRARFDRHDE